MRRRQATARSVERMRVGAARSEAKAGDADASRFTEPSWSRHGRPVRCAAMALYVVRLWLPDRPGALGQVASRIGAVRGDVVGIEILERGAGRAIDELVVRLPDDGLVE